MGECGDDRAPPVEMGNGCEILVGGLLVGGRSMDGWLVGS